MVGHLPDVAYLPVQHLAFAGEEGSPFTDGVVDEVIASENPHLLQGLEVGLLDEEFIAIEESHQDLGVLPELLLPHQGGHHVPSRPGRSPPSPDRVRLVPRGREGA